MNQPDKAARKKAFGKLLKQKREARVLSQSDVAQSLNILDDNMISRWERGDHTPRAVYLKQLVDLFQLTPEELALLSKESAEAAEETALPPSNTASSSLPTLLSLEQIESSPPIQLAEASASDTQSFPIADMAVPITQPLPSKRKRFSRRTALIGLLGFGTGMGTGVGGTLKVLALKAPQLLQNTSAFPGYATINATLPRICMDEPIPTPSALYNPHDTTTPLPPGATLVTYNHHFNVINAIAWSLDGQRVVSASSDTTLQIWNPITGATYLFYKGHTQGVGCVAWSPNGKYIASGSEDHTVQIWEATTGKLLYTYTGHVGNVQSVAWSPDGTRIASASATVHVWYANGQGDITIYRGHTATVWSVAWSPDGKSIASGSQDGTVHLWNVASSRRYYKFTGHSRSVYMVAWSPDGTRIASASGDQTAQIWDVNGGYNVYIYRGHTDEVHFVGWSPIRNRVASGGNDKTVQIWDTTNTYTGIYRGASGVAWSPNGKLMASSGGSSTVYAKVWQVE